MADKPIQLINGRLTQVEAITSSAGAGSSGKIPALDSGGRLAANMMPIGVIPDTKSIVTSENLSAGDFVNVYNNGGTFTARKADATTDGKTATGFVLTAATAPAAVDVYFEGVNNQRSGLTAGRYYLDTTAGGITATPPSGAGNVVQYVGTAISATEITFEPSDGVVLSS
jgi:hypothetical protein